MVEITLIEHPAPEIELAIEGPLIAYNDQVAAPARWVPIAVVLRDAGDGPVTGGLWGAFFYDWLHIRLLAVPEGLRGQGWGTRLMQRAEAFTRTQDGIGIVLDTFSFQARGFYEKLGFTCFGELHDHPRGGARYYMQKRF